MPVLSMFSTDLGKTAVRARGLSYSALLHGLLMVASLYIPWSYWMPAEPHLGPVQSALHAGEVLLLPALEPLGGHRAERSSANKAKKQGDERDAAASASGVTAGVVYKGPQLIVSNPPYPDNSVQTILQPDIPRAPKLPFPLPLPPMVTLAAPKSVAVVAPHPKAAVEAPHENAPGPKEPVKVAEEPVRLPERIPKVAAAKLPLAVDTAADARLLNRTVAVPLPTLPHQEQTTASGNQPHNILVLNAIPVPDPDHSELPPGELNGAFTISPVPLSARPGMTVIGARGGTEVEGVPGKADGNSAGTGGEHAGLGSSGARSGHGSAGGNGRGSGAGTSPGGHGSGTGAGPESGSGNSPFPNITIQGGSGGGGSLSRTPSTGTPPAQGTYGITIIASGASGGGFKDFGVFRDEASYTVYVDMTDSGAKGSSWTLQYALNSHHKPSDPPAPPHGLLSPPYATSKTLPLCSADLMRRGRGGTIVVSGVINSIGKFEELKVMQSPDPGLNELTLEALRKWEFRPSEMDGGKVPVKFLLGVPVNSLPGK